MEPLEQTSFEVVVVGTGITESIVAAACARIGKSVLHLDKNEYYGGTNATLTLKDLFTLIQDHQERQQAAPSQAFSSGPSPSEVALDPAYFSSVFQHFDESCFWPANVDKEAALGRFRSYSLDLVPQLLYCRGAMVELLISSDVGRYLEYKALERIYTALEDKSFEMVPLSKEDVFLSQTVSVVDKRRLMKFLTFCLDHENQPQEYQDHVDLPFSQFLASKQITGHLQSVIQFAIALDQRGDVTTGEGLRLVKQHLNSLGRYGHTAFLWPMYGISETSQAFCRLTAIFGGVYMLRCRPQKFLLQPGANPGASKIAETVLSESDQTVSCRFVVANLDYIPTKDQAVRFSRALLVVEGPLHPETVVDFTVIPPGRFGNPHPIYLIHSDQNSGSAPEGKDVIYLSTISHHPTAREDLQAVVEHYFSPKSSDGAEAETKPSLLYALYYSQRVRETDWTQPPENFFAIQDVGHNLTNEECVAEARGIFEAMFPGEEFLPATPRPEEALSVEAILAQESAGGAGFSEAESSS